ncbi:hypothetical protein ELG77_08870 [Rhizobium leguminosarum]|uniref:DUF5677 domain-containing protein n=1 Tax=Rhizobium leguminosarum TaxID=384 RepID=UPI0010307C30|nr:DUF5677 domain-containing protein [Rhizobium leguminosarum]TBG41873.1 hypothetical protein ELG77_08870 [Rhizobium leguminosarum]
MLEYVFELHNRAVRCIADVKFNKHDEIQRILICLYATILEQCESIAILISNRRPAGTDAILRSILEAMVDMTALLADPSYLHFMNAAYHKEWAKLIEQGVSGDNRFLEGFGEQEGIPKALANHRAQLQVLKEQGYEPLNNYERFRRADMVEEYRAIYNMLCSESHNNIRVLINRHMVAADGDIALNLSSDNGEYEVTLDSVAGVLLAATLAMHKAFASGTPEAFEDLNKQLWDMRKARDG